MLKLDNVLLTYSPQTERVIQISGHMLRQSVMGSDFSYNDIMEDKPLDELYNAKIEGEEYVNGRKCYVLYLEAKVEGISYPKRREWVDQEYFLPIKEELYAKSGKLLKSTSMDVIKKIGDRWFPSRFIFKDELKKNSLSINQMVPKFYSTTDKRLWPAASMSLYATLLSLKKKNRILWI